MLFEGKHFGCSRSDALFIDLKCQTMPLLSFFSKIKNNVNWSFWLERFHQRQNLETIDFRRKKQSWIVSFCYLPPNLKESKRLKSALVFNLLWPSTFVFFTNTTLIFSNKAWMAWFQASNNLRRLNFRYFPWNGNFDKADISWRALISNFPRRTN